MRGENSSQELQELPSLVKTTSEKGKQEGKNSMKRLLLSALVASGLAFVPVKHSDAQIYVGIPGIVGVGFGYPTGYYGYPGYSYSGYYPYGYYRPYYYSGSYYYSQPYSAYYYTGPSYYWYNGHKVYYRHRHHRHHSYQYGY
jgi:hypothetical protein